MFDWITWSKLLNQVIDPFNLMLWMLLLSLGSTLRNHRRLAKVALSCAVLTLLICSSPLSTMLYEKHERLHLPVKVSDSESADAIVVLGGDVGLPLPPRYHSEVNGNRTLHAMRLYKAGKAPMIVLTGGNVFLQKEMRSEAYYSAKLLIAWGVPSDVIFLEGDSRNTYENAKKTQKLLEPRQIDKILLVTSAFHMERALRTFRTAGVACIPSPSSYSMVEYSKPLLLDWIPSMGNFGKMRAVIHEKLGILVYGYRGWIS